ncbi:MAG TPA: hypothetical protein VNW99_05945, partial [Cytophagaceae bacterium]|nr:hypothetical protein [Cytophagaceae bacterium]
MPDPGDKDDKENNKKGHVHHVVENEHDETDSAKSHSKFKYRIALDGIFTKGNVDRKLITLRNILSYEVKKFTISTNTYAASGSQNKKLAEEE